MDLFQTFGNLFSPEENRKLNEYWNDMKIKRIVPEPVDYDLSVYFTFKSNNIDCEFILN